MKEKRDCKIVQDLLPNYIEKLTNKETNEYIEEHLKQCDECKKMLENMQKDIEVNTQKRDKREVKYIKKYSNKMRVLKTIILLILLIFVAATGRKIYIISDLSSKAEKSITYTNYHKTIYSHEKGNYTKSEIFSLENKKKIVTTIISDEGKKTMTMYGTKTGEDSQGFEQYLINTYIETEDSKTAKLNQNGGISVDPQNPLYTENIVQLILQSIPTSIKETTFYNKECYYISNFEGVYSPGPEGMYIDKETGLLIGLAAYEYKNPDGTEGRMPASEYLYEFDVVTDTDFVEPDISEFEVK